VKFRGKGFPAKIPTRFESDSMAANNILDLADQRAILVFGKGI
jgi:hypothetical protein